MRTAIKKTDVYKFEELSESVKENAINNLYDINVDYDGWYEDDYLLDPLDYNDGNSAMFSWKHLYFDLDRGSYIQFVDLVINDEDGFRKVLGFTPEQWEKISYGFENGYRNSNTKIILEWVRDEEPTKEDEETMESAEETFKDLVDDALIRLRKSYEYLTSEEVIIETIEANEYEFDVNGNLY